MDDNRFDALARALGARLPRRAIVRALAATPTLDTVPVRSARAAEVCPSRVPRPGYTPTTNGCGPASFGSQIIPQRYGKARFGPSCNRHDACYGTCNADRNQCDRDFQIDLKRACYAAYPGRANHREAVDCSNRAQRYHDAVRTFGAGAYATAQEEACICCDDRDPDFPTGPRCGTGSAARCCEPRQTCVDGKCCDADGACDCGPSARRRALGAATALCCADGREPCGDRCCSSGETCSSGRCCSDGQTNCGGECTDTSNDMANCGACGKTCDKKACEKCVGGECIKPEPDPCSPCNPDTGKPEPKCSAEKDPKAPDCANGTCVCGSGTMCNDGTKSWCCTDIFYRPDGSRAGCCCFGRTTHPATGAEICYPCSTTWCYCSGGIGGQTCCPKGTSCRCSGSQPTCLAG